MANATIPRVINGVCCCSICCHVTWVSTYDCDSAVWSDPIESTEEPPFLVCGPCPSDVPWFQPGSNPCERFYISYYAIPDLCGDCDDVAHTPPAKPTGVPPDCCEGECCRWIFTAVFTGTCPFGTWVVDLSSSTPDTACSADTDWTTVGQCIAQRTMYTLGPCDTPPDPGIPSFYPPDCCCCVWVFTATYDCDSEVWNVVNDPPTDSVCTEDTDWVQTGTCTYTRTMYSEFNGSICEPMPDPGEPLGGAAPPGCCEEPCGDCGEGTTEPVPNTQPPCVISGIDNPPCVFHNGAGAPTTYAPAPYASGYDCYWDWRGDSDFGPGTISIALYSIGGVIVTATFGAATLISVSVICIDGVLTGTAIFDLSPYSDGAGYGCTGSTAIVTFG